MVLNDVFIYVFAPLSLTYVVFCILFGFMFLYIYLQGCFITHLEYKLNKKNFINIIDLIQEPDECAIVMEYFEGVTLKDYFAKNKKISDNQIKEIFLSMLNAVEGAHSLGIIHRDIKPSNFMIGINNTIKLMDFGIAKNVNANNLEYTQTVINTNIGTPLYMSPEQVKGLGNVTYSTDIYSLGILLWEMVMGKSLYAKNLSINEIK